MQYDRRLLLRGVFATAGLLVLDRVRFANAGRLFCAHCGCDQGCQKVCRVVKEEKKVNVVCWGAKSEEFCPPGHSHRGCKHCEEVCDECETGPDAVQTKPKPFVWFDWCPGCSNHVYTKTKLMKKTVVKTVPSYKWVLEDLCEKCLKKAEEGKPPPPGTPLPPPPKAPGAKVVINLPD